MEDWSVDYINSCCRELFDGKVICELSPSKGRILVAQRHFRQGELIFHEPPLHIVVAKPNDAAFQRVKHLTEAFQDTSYQPLWYWAALCSLTAAELGSGSTLQPVREEQQKKLLCLYHEPVVEATPVVVALVKELQLPVDPLKVEELLRCWILNCFEHSDDPEGYSAYFISSFMSHSCKPNAIWHEGSDAMHVVRARLDIQRGEEICISYLSEEMLMYSAVYRRKALRRTKLFTCTCERCEGPAGADWCRGFRCPHCGVCGIFPPPGSLQVEELARLPCHACGKSCGDFAAGLLDTEKSMRQRLQSMNEVSCLQLSDEEVRQLQDLVGDRAGGALGPQHWLCERLWTLLVPWFNAQNRTTEALQILEGRVGYQRKMFPWPNATRAWTMQRCCRLLLRQYKTTSQEKGRWPVKKDAPRRMLARALTLQEEALQLLALLFGDEHRYAARAKKKLRRLKALADKARPGATSAAGGAVGVSEGSMA